MKVLLTAINAKYIHSNLAVYSLRAYAGKYAQQTEIAEYTINQTMDDILSDIYRKKPDILCLSCYLWNILYVEQLITEIHKVLPKMQIWLGGPEVSYNAVSVMEQYPQVTGVMCGEGEETFLELMEYWNQERESLDTIKGIVYRENGTCRQNPPRPVMITLRIFRIRSFIMNPVADVRFPAAIVSPRLINVSVFGIWNWSKGSFSFSLITKCRK